MYFLRESAKISTNKVLIFKTMHIQKYKFYRFDK